MELMKKYWRWAFIGLISLYLAFELFLWGVYLALAPGELAQSYVGVDAIERAFGARRPDDPIESTFGIRPFDGPQPLPRSELPREIAALCFEDGLGPDEPCRLARTPYKDSCQPLHHYLSWPCASVVLSPRFMDAPEALARVKEILRNPCAHIPYTRTDAVLTDDLSWRREFCPSPPPRAYRLVVEVDGRTITLGHVAPGP